MGDSGVNDFNASILLTQIFDNGITLTMLLRNANCAESFTPFFGNFTIGVLLHLFKPGNREI
jgi:hypothetical protein